MGAHHPVARDLNHHSAKPIGIACLPIQTPQPGTVEIRWQKNR
jgi:hypothetical protein